MQNLFELSLFDDLWLYPKCFENIITCGSLYVRILSFLIIVPICKFLTSPIFFFLFSSSYWYTLEESIWSAFSLFLNYVLSCLLLDFSRPEYIPLFLLEYESFWQHFQFCLHVDHQHLETYKHLFLYPLSLSRILYYLSKREESITLGRTTTLAVDVCILLFDSVGGTLWILYIN